MCAVVYLSMGTLSGPDHIAQQTSSSRVQVNILFAKLQISLINLL
jgi:hypothetical protein